MEGTGGGEQDDELPPAQHGLQVPRVSVVGEGCIEWIVGDVSLSLQDPLKCKCRKQNVNKTYDLLPRENLPRKTVTRSLVKFCTFFRCLACVKER